VSSALILSPANAAPSADLIRAALERHLTLHPIESAAAAREHGGIIVPCEPAERLWPIAATLAEAGVKTAIVPTDRLTSIGRSTRASGISFDADDLVFEHPLGPASRVPRSNVVGATLHGLPQSREHDDEKSDDSPSWITEVRKSLEQEKDARTDGVEDATIDRFTWLTRTFTRRLEEQSLDGMSIVLTLYARSPLRAFRCVREDLGFAGLGERKTQNSLENLLLLLDDLVRRLPDDCRLEALEELLEDPRPDRLLVDSEKEAANRDRWFLYWAGTQDEES